MEYITTKEASEKWGISTVRIAVLAREGRIPGAKQLGRGWLIPASATKPPELKAGHSHISREKPDTFSFPLYPFRPDWNQTAEAQLSEQQRSLLLAETAVLECRFTDAYSLIQSILAAPDDIAIEIGCLWTAGMCCIALNKPEDFSRSYLRLQLLLSDDFPHRDDLVIILDFLKTYVETLKSASTNEVFNTDIHDQCLPLMWMQIGYSQLIKEAITLDSANATMLEMGLRFLQTTCSHYTIEMVHIYLMGIYSLRQNMNVAKKHAKAAVEIAYENKLYFPLVTYYHYNTLVLDPILAQYPEDFQNHCHELNLQYKKNFAAFLSSIYEGTVFSKLKDEDYPYIYAVLRDFTNPVIAEKLGISKPTVNRKLLSLYETLGVKNKKELKEYLLNYM